MSAAACKAAICLNNARTTIDTVQGLAIRPFTKRKEQEFSDDQLNQMAACADKFVKDIVGIVTQDK